MAAGSGALELRAMATRRRDVLFLEEEGRRGRSKAAATATEPAWKAALGCGRAACPRWPPRPCRAGHWPREQGRERRGPAACLAASTARGAAPGRARASPSALHAPEREIGERGEEREKYER